MIDYFALALGHGLLALALLRLAMWRQLDDDPALRQASDARKAEADAQSAAARAERRRRSDKGDHEGEQA
ncbi:hypothetical protein [Erythrobacter sp.]|jgi:hypothetical protein|uniref:hypothetical protein n=1 Tax=Erythrobacter sp. TaxID=1042 RepID=UPI002EC6625C|nr:hypothetical protein [Erythrobacter sp.]